LRTGGKRAGREKKEKLKYKTRNQTVSKCETVFNLTSDHERQINSSCFLPSNQQRLSK
jgi:hypothetical protein